MGKFVRNHWYAAAWSSELGDAPLGRRILGEPIVLFRQADGAAAALFDRCPHRLMPLSLGTLSDGRIQCGYHGLVFDGTGQCVHVPSQDMIPPKAQTRSFPAVERYGLVWLWLGAPELADPAKLPVIDKYGEPGWELLEGGYQHHPSGYINIVENLMDPAHTTFVHKQTIGNPGAAAKAVTMERGDDYIVAYKWLENAQPSPLDRQLMAFEGEKVDRGQFFYYYVPSMSRVDICVMPSGMEHTDENMNKGVRNNSYKFLTPESDSATHFFWLHLRNYRVGDQEWSDKMRANLEKTYLEDRDVEMALQAAQEEFGIRQLATLEIDRAPIIAVKMIDRLIEAEEAAAG